MIWLLTDKSRKHNTQNVEWSKNASYHVISAAYKVQEGPRIFTSFTRQDSTANVQIWNIRNGPYDHKMSQIPECQKSMDKAI